MSKKLFGVIVGMVIVVVSISIVLLLKKNVRGFDSVFVVPNDCTPFNLFVSKGEEEFSAKIVWETKGKCMGFVQYGLDRNSLEKVGIDTVYEYRSQKHEVVLEKLLTKDKYYFLINSDNIGFGSNGKPLEFILEDL